MNGIMGNIGTLAYICIPSWIIFSAILVTIICINSSRLSRIDEPFKDPAELAEERRLRRPR